jgi:hypothetical protein
VARVKTCSKCKQAKLPERFAISRSQRDGRDSWCRDCRNEARRAAYAANLSRERQRSLDYYASHREQKKRYYAEHRQELNAAQRARWHTDPAYREKHNAGRRSRYTCNPEQNRISYMKRHGGIDEWARMYEAQDGRCYLCGETLKDTPQKFVVVDHDHDCCEGGIRTESCDACRRGLAHGWCNQLIGLCGEDMDVLRAIIANFEKVSPETKRRIAAKQEAQAVLSVDAGGAIAEVPTTPMPDLDMPVGMPWPETSGALW